MHAGIVTGLLDPKRMSESIGFWKKLRKGCAAEGGYLVIDPKTGEWMSFDLWQTEVDAQRIKKVGNS